MAEGYVLKLLEQYSKLVKNIFCHRRDYYVESRTRLLSLRRFVALPKIVQTDYQP